MRVAAPHMAVERTAYLAGFLGVCVRHQGWAAAHRYTDDEAWWLSLWSHGIRSRFEQLEAPALEKVKTDMLRKVQVLKQPDGIHTLFWALFAVERKPYP